MTKANVQTILLAGRQYTVADVVTEPDEYVRLEAVDLCFALTHLIHDHSVLVRCAVARKKVGHDVLVKDQDWHVRATVAKYCIESHFLDILAQDSHEFVRFVVVKRGYASDYLVNDTDEEIAAIARYNLQYQRAA
jgi:hypothetical protein